MFRDLLRLVPFVRKYKGRLLGGIVLFFIARLFEAAVPLCLMVGINRLTRGESDLLWPILGIVGAVVARFLIVSWARIAVRRAGFLVQYDLRHAFYKQLQRMGPTFYRQYAIGDLMTRAVADIQLIRRLIGNGTTMVVIFCFATLIGFTCMVFLSPALTLFVLPPLPILLFYTWRTSLRLGVASRQVQERLSALGSHVQENLSGIRTVQAMALERQELDRFDVRNQDYTDAFYSHARIHSIMHSVMPTLAAASAIAILGYGGYSVLQGSLSIGAFTAFFFYVNMIVQPFRVAGMIISMLQRAAVASRRLFAVFDAEPEIEDQASPWAPELIRGNVEFRQLTFAYEDASKRALNNINLSIRRGDVITFMGRIGSGKTTLLKQVVRLLDTPRDSVFIDEFDVRDYPLNRLRSQVAYVPQDTFLFGEPLRSNISYDQPRRNIDQVWLAAEAASLSESIEEMAFKMETVVGERGVTLSGGQKQRATLARGLIRNAPVLILDDCFSSVDTETEEQILSSLSTMRANKTTLLVSHRVSTARHSDRIVILEDGQIAETGTHEQLLSLNGIYAELERIQREGSDEPIGSAAATVTAS
ncbi:MAG: ABC transporter ATP-binding protein [Gammaproteobacteria bacterium]|nr:ABC transporter ATP-binding protein [Gammaproteobacteria bacterium]MYD80184.1 ABC transporter ATP-binding protein [Gammaproteobacteria bacterium]